MRDDRLRARLERTAARAYEETPREGLSVRGRFWPAGRPPGRGPPDPSSPCGQVLTGVLPGR
jgi:hypothetical protein